MGFEQYHEPAAELSSEEAPSGGTPDERFAATAVQR